MIEKYLKTTEIVGGERARENELKWKRQIYQVSEDLLT